MARTEQLGIRCSEISSRHRLWGDVPIADLDFLVINYDRRKVEALIDYKCGPITPNFDSANCDAQSDLATRAGIPFFIAVYYVGPWLFEVYAANQAAYKLLGQRTDMTEQEYVAFLYRLRGRKPPQQLLDTLNGWPWEYDLPPLPWGPDPTMM